MEDLSDVKGFAEIYEKAMSALRDTDFIVNHVQMKKYLATIHFLEDMVAQYNSGSVRAAKFEPKVRNGEVIVKCVGFTIIDDDMEPFKKILSYCSGFDVTPLLNGKVELSFTIPNVFMKKQNGIDLDDLNDDDLGLEDK